MSAGSRPDEITAPPRVPRNRPGLDALSYRVGTYASFRRAMLESRFSVEVEVDGAAFSPLQGWTTRAGDYGTALLEMWAYIADILTFYQERIANEAFLRTARQDESVLRLAALLGYERAPGKAAHARLAFTVEDEMVQIPTGLRIQSVAGQEGETQVFETVQEASAALRLNSVRVFPEPAEWDPEAESLEGSTEALLHPSRAGSIAAALAPGDPFVMFSIPSENGEEDDEAPVLEEKEVGALRATDEGIWLSWSPAIGPKLSWTSCAFEFVRKLRFFGYNAPNEYLKANTRGNEIIWEHEFHDPENSTRNDYVIISSEGPDGLYLSLDGVYDDLKLGTKLLLYIPQGFEDSRSYLALLDVSSVGQRQEELYPLSDTVTRIGVKVDEINGTPGTLPPFDRREAVLYELSETEIVFWTYKYADAFSGDLVVARTEDLAAQELESGRTVVLADSEGNAEVVTIRSTEPMLYGGVSHTKISLQVPVVVTVPVRITGRAPGAAEGGVLQQVTDEVRVQGLRGDIPREIVVDVSALGVNESLTLRSVRLPEGVTLISDREKVVVAVTAPTEITEETEATGTVEETEGEEGTEEVLPEELEGPAEQNRLGELDARTAILLGNVGRATHGETISREILGDGDSSASFQAFVLKNAPVTFAGSPEAPGAAANTLKIEVGGVRWREVDELLGHGAEERIYTTMVDAEGRMTVRFGDGATGARLPTGTANVVAHYRQGLGKVGNVKKGTLTTPLDLPLGLKSVTNPEDAFGGTDPDPAAKVREIAPGRTRTVDRIVSLSDFEVAARQYDGVAKALAVLIEEAGEPVVRLTVAGDAGARIPDEACLKLKGYLDSRRNPECRLKILPYEKVPVEVAVKIRVHQDYEKEDVRAAVQDALTDFFAFDKLEFGQPIYLSDVYARLARVAGVTALRVTRLRFKDREENEDAGDGIPEALRLEPTQLATLEVSDATVTTDLGET